MARFAGLFTVAFGVVLGLVGVGVAVAAVGRPAAEPVMLGVGIAVAGAGVLAFVAGLVVLRATRNRAWTGGAKAGDRVGGYLSGVPQPREVDGFAYDVLFTPAVKRGKHSTPSSLKVRVPAESPATVRFSRRTRFDNFGHAVGLARPVPTDDPEFDAKVATRASHDAYADRVVLVEPTRRAVADLLAAGFPKVGLTGAHAEAEWPGFDPLKHDRPGLSADAARGLVSLAAARPDPAEFDLSPRARPHVPLWVMLGGSALLIVAAPVYPPVRESGLFALGAVVFAGAYPLFALLAAVLVRGTTVGHDRWLALALGSFPLIAVASVGAVAAANGALDPGPEAVRDCPVVDRTTSRSKNKTTYRVVVADWSRPGATLSYEVSHGEYDAVRPGQSRVLVRTRPGGLGVEWQIGRRVEP